MLALVTAALMLTSEPSSSVQQQLDALREQIAFQAAQLERQAARLHELESAAPHQAGEHAGTSGRRLQSTPSAYLHLAGESPTIFLGINQEVRLTANDTTLDVEAASANFQGDVRASSLITASGNSVDATAATLESVQSTVGTLVGSVDASDWSLSLGHKQGLALKWNGAADTYLGMTALDSGTRTFNRGFIGFAGTSAAGAGQRDIVLATAEGTADASPLERLRVTSEGQVGVGTASPLEVLHVVGAQRTSGYKATTIEFSTFFVAGEHAVATISGAFESGTVAVASFEYVSTYAYAASNLSGGRKMAVVRRANSNTAFEAAKADTHTFDGSSGGSPHPDLYWSSQGVLTISVPTYAQISGVVRVTAHGSGTTLSRSYAAAE